MVLSMERWKGKVAVITGASAGIEAAIAERLTCEGMFVVGLARRHERIQQLSSKLSSKPGTLIAMQVDVTNEAALVETFQHIEENIGPVHVLVNNAGIVRDTNLMEGSTKDWRDVMETNVIALSVSTREAVKSMRKNNVNGHVININSLAGHYVPPLRNFNMYPASKHAVTAITETLRQELNLAGVGIKITSISPGATKTEITETNNLDGAFREDFLKGARLQTEDVADAIVYALSTPPHVQVHELMLRALGEVI